MIPDALTLNSRANLTEALGIRDGVQVGAIDDAVMVPEVATITIPATLKGAGMVIG